ncbi:hypothetical protein CYMTET_10688, partial [Cymbomonas tetramitiformis]
MKSGESLQIGQRVCTEDGALATVRYVGPVEGTKHEWAGVEWDDPSRGKHDGSHGGKRYFECAGVGESCASFVRFHKILAGVTFMDAMKNKYQAQSKGTSVENAAAENMYIDAGNTGRRVDVQLVGKQDILEKQSKLDELVSVYLPDSCVDTAGPRGEISGEAGKISELDISGNLFEDWSAIQRFNEELPALEHLEVSGMPLRWPDSLPAAMAFANLKTLVMNNTGVAWSQMRHLHTVVPALEELHLCGNQISSLSGTEGEPTNADCFPNLRSLFLEDNDLQTWDQVVPSQRAALVVLRSTKPSISCLPPQHIAAIIILGST